MNNGFVDGTIISNYAKEHSMFFKSILPEMVKKLILNSSPSINEIRMPGLADVWAPGFDGIVYNARKSKYVCSGCSVWEIGTSRNYRKKINDDYNKRTLNPCGIDITSTEIYFVTPYIWASNNKGCSISEWEKDHKGKWKAIHIIDAPVLADWLNSEPAVLSWFLDQFDRNDLGFCDVLRAWKRFSAKTDPPFSRGLFLAGREEEINSFFDSFHGKKTFVKSDTTIDAYGFCLSALLLNPALNNTVIVIDNYKSYKFLSSICKGKVFLLNFKLADDLIEGNHTIMCFNKEDRTIQEDIKLVPISKSLFEKAIKEMKLSEKTAYSIYSQTHGNLLSLIRKIPGTSTDSCPKWANQDRIYLLVPLLLLRYYDCQNECDRSLVAYLANEKYEIIDEKYRDWAKLEDTPLKCVDNYYILNDYEESWTVLDINTSSVFFKRYVDSLYLLLLKGKDRNINGFLISDYQATNYLNILLSNLPFFSSESEDDTLLIQTVNKLLKTIPTNLLIEYIYLISLATPSIVINYLLDDYKSETGIIESEFKEVSSKTDYCKILITIEELARHEETSIKACNLLFNLCIKTKSFIFPISNSPRESLLNVLCLWDIHTVISLDDKVQLIKRYMDKEPDFTSQFAVDLLSKRHQSLPSRKIIKTIDIYQGELFDAYNCIAAMVFDYCISIKRIDVLKKLLAIYYLFYDKTLIDAADKFQQSDYNKNELVSLNYELRRLTIIESQKDLSNRRVSSLNYWINKTTTSDEFGNSYWMFYDYYGCIMLSDNCDRMENEKRLYYSRKIIVEKILEEHSVDELIELICISKDVAEWGYFYSEFLRGDVFIRVTHFLLNHNKFSILCGIVDNVSINDCKSFINSLSDDQFCKILRDLNRKDIIVFLDTPQKEQAYWSHQIMREYDEISFFNLLKYNPFNLLPYYAYFNKDSLKYEDEKIKRVFLSILNFNSPNRKCHLDAIDVILEKVFSFNLYSEEWAEICINLLNCGLLQKYPKILNLFYFINPHRLCEKVKSNRYDAYSEFYLYYELPEQAFNDENAFRHFVITIIVEHSDNDLLLNVLGSILGKSQPGIDGIFPHEFVRRIIEDCIDTDLINEIKIGKLNSRGARIVQDGINEKSLNAKYKADATKIEIFYPKTAQLLREIGDEFLFESKHDRILSEIGLLR